jgi:hypothetical protein
MAPIRAVCAVPPVSGEFECIRRSAAANIHTPFGPSAALKDDDVVRKTSVSTPYEALVLILLKNANCPTTGALDGIESHHCTIDTDKGNCSHAAEEFVSLHPDIPRLSILAALRDWWTEELQSGAAADVHPTSTGVFESIPPDCDIARSSFGLHAIRGWRIVVTKDVVFDQPAMAADHVDSRAAAGTPALDSAIYDLKIIYSGKFDSVGILPPADVSDLQRAEDDVMRGLAAAFAIIDVQAITGQVLEDEVVQLDVSGLRKMNADRTLSEDRRLFRVRCGDDNRLPRLALEMLEVVAATVNAGSEQYAHARFRRVHRSAKLNRIPDRNIGGLRSQSCDRKEEDSSRDEWIHCRWLMRELPAYS